jgi:hypothetical protein
MNFTGFCQLFFTCLSQNLRDVGDRERSTLGPAPGGREWHVAASGRQGHGALRGNSAISHRQGHSCAVHTVLLQRARQYCSQKSFLLWIEERYTLPTTMALLCHVRTIGWALAYAQVIIRRKEKIAVFV